MDYLLILTRPRCIFCKKLKEALDELNIPYKEQHTNRLVVPQILNPYSGEILISGLPYKTQLIELKNDITL